MAPRDWFCGSHEVETLQALPKPAASSKRASLAHRQPCKIVDELFNPGQFRLPGNAHFFVILLVRERQKLPPTIRWDDMNQIAPSTLSLHSLSLVLCSDLISP